MGKETYYKDFPSRTTPLRISSKGLDGLGARVLEIHFTHAFLFAHGFDFFPQGLAEFDRIADGMDVDAWQGPVRSFDMDGPESDEAHPPEAHDEDVFHAVKLHFIDVLVENSGGDAEALGGEFVNVAADDKVSGNDPDQRNDQACESQRERHPTG